MSWYSGSHVTPTGWGAPSAVMYPLRVARFAGRFAWVRAAGLGSFVVPDENWMTAMSSAPTSAAAWAAPEIGPLRLDAVTQPSAGAEFATATPRKRRIRSSVTTMTAPTAFSIALVLRWNSSIFPNRNGGYSGTGIAPAHSTPKKHSTNSGQVGNTRATRSPLRTPRRTRRAPRDS